MQNFDITGVPIAHFPQLIRALAMVKKAAALANHELGQLDTKKKDAILKACDELIEDGKWYDRKYSIDAKVVVRLILFQALLSR
jgi:aspartate ammonia-lyase